MVSTNVVDLSFLDQRPDLRLLQVLGLVLVSGSKVSAHAAVVAGDDDTTFAGGLDIIDTVFSVDTSLCASVLEEIGILVLSNAANVDDRVVGENVLDNVRKRQFFFLFLQLEFTCAPRAVFWAAPPAMSLASSFISSS